MAVSWKQIAYTSQIREILTADRTYYVRADGHDGASGLNDTDNATTGAWLTPQHGIDVLTGNSLDYGGKTVTLDIGSGTFDHIVMNAPWLGGGNLVINGDITTPANVVLDGGNHANAIEVYASLPGLLYIQGLKLISTNAGGLFHAGIGTIWVGEMDYGTISGDFGHLCPSVPGAYIWLWKNYTISGGGGVHYYPNGGGGIYFANNKTATLTGTPDFPYGFCYCDILSLMWSSGAFSGAGTGPRYYVNGNGVINTAGAGANYFPGDSAGSEANGGKYI